MYSFDFISFGLPIFLIFSLIHDFSPNTSDFSYSLLDFFVMKDIWYDAIYL